MSERRLWHTSDLAPGTDSNVGAGLPAMRACQSPKMLTDPPQSQASQLPHFYAAHLRDQRRLLTSAGTSSPAMRLRNSPVRANSNVVTGTVIDNKIGINHPCNTGPDLSTEK